MKKILYSFVALYILLPMVASAATFSFSPTTGSFSTGKTFSVMVYVNPSAGEEITTAKLSAIFPANMLEVVSFKGVSGWIPLTTPGYDLTDNVAGKIIKTGGIPARITTSKQFGTLTLKAKSAGTATINIEEDSMILDSANVNKFVNSKGASFTIAKPTTVSKPKTTSTPTPTKVSKTNTSVVSTTKSTTTTATTTSQNQLAAVIESGTDVGVGANRNFWYYFIAIIAILGGGIFAWRKFGKK